MSFPTKKQNQSIPSFEDVMGGQQPAVPSFDEVMGEKKNPVASQDGGTPSPSSSNGPSFSERPNFFTSPEFTFKPATPVTTVIGDKKVDLQATAPAPIADKKLYAEGLKRKIDSNEQLTPDEYRHVKEVTGYDDMLTNLALQKNDLFYDVKRIKEDENQKASVVDYLKNQDEVSAQFGLGQQYGNYDLEDPANVSQLAEKFDAKKKELEAKASEFNPLDSGKRLESFRAKDELNPNSSFMQQYQKIKDIKSVQIATNLIKQDITDPKAVGLEIQKQLNKEENERYLKTQLPDGVSKTDFDPLIQGVLKDTPLQDYGLTNEGANYLQKALALQISKKKLAGEDSQKDVQDLVRVNETQRDLYNKYPDVRYGEIVQQITNAKAAEVGITSDSEDVTVFNRIGYTTSGDDVIRLAKEQGLYNNPLDKKLVDKIAGQQEVNPLMLLFLPGYSILKKINAPIENFSFAGQFVEGAKGVATSSSQSIVDLLKLRPNSSISAEQYNDDIINSWKKDQSNLDATQKDIALVGNTTGQIVGQALSTLAISGAGKAAALSQDAIENLGFWGSGALASYGDGKKSMLDLTNSDAKAESGALMIAFINAASEGIFKDTKVFGDVFNKRLGNILNNIDEDKLYTQSTRNTLTKFLKSEVPQWVAKTGVESNKEATEEFLTAVGQDIIESTFGDNKQFDVTKTWENARDTYVSMLIGGSLAAGKAAHTDIRMNPNAAASLHHAAQAPNYYISAIQQLKNKGQISDAEANKKIQIINTATKINNELTTIDSGLNDRQKAAYVSYRTTQAQMQEMADNTTDVTLKAKLESNIKVLDEQKDKILNGLQFNENLQPLDNLFDKEQAYLKAKKVAEEKGTPEAMDALQNAKTDYANDIVNYYTKQNVQGEQQTTGTENGAAQTQATQTQATQAAGTQNIQEPVADNKIVPTFEQIKLKIPDNELAATQDVITKINNAENINEKDLAKGQEGLYSALENHPEAAHLIEPLILKLQNYEFATKTATRTVTEEVSTGRTAKTQTEIKPALEQSTGSSATITKPDGTTVTGNLSVQDGNYVISNQGRQSVVVGEKAITDRDLKFPSETEVPDRIKFDENQNVSSVTFQTRSGDLVTINDPEKALDLAIQLQSQELGSVPDAAFKEIYTQVQKTISEEVPADNTIVAKENKINEDIKSLEQQRAAAIEKVGVPNNKAKTEELKKINESFDKQVQDKKAELAALSVTKKDKVVGEHKGIKILDTKDAQKFHDAIKGAIMMRQSDRFQADVHPVEYYQEILDTGGKLYLAENGMFGAFVQVNGYMGSLFKNPNADTTGVAKVLQRIRTENGGKFFDAYGTHLEKMYVKNGFRPVARLKFNEEYAPEGWQDSNLKDKPDVVFFVYDPNADFKVGEGDYFDDWDKAYIFAKNYETTNTTAGEGANGTVQKTVSNSQNVSQEGNQTGTKTGQEGKQVVPSGTKAQDNITPKEEPSNPTENKKTYSERSKEIADKIRNAELPQWLVNTNPDIKASGITGQSLKNALANSVELVGQLLDKGVELKEAISQGVASLKKFYIDNNAPYDEKSLADGFEQYVKDQLPTKETIKSIADQIRNDEISYNDAIEGKSENFIKDLSNELFGSRKFSFDPDSFKEQVRRQKTMGLTQEEVVQLFESSKKLTRDQRRFIEEVYATDAATDRIAAELQEAFKQIAKGEKPKAVLERLSVSNVRSLVNALKDALTYKAVSNEQLEKMVDYVVSTIDLKKADQVVDSIINNQTADMKQLLRSKLIVALQKEGNVEMAKRLIKDMADEAVMSGRQTQSLKRAYEILGAQGNATMKTEFARRAAEAVQKKAMEMTARYAEVINEKNAEISKLNERIHQKAQSSPLMDKIKDVISNLCGLRNKK